MSFPGQFPGDGPRGPQDRMPGDGPQDQFGGPAYGPGMGDPRMDDPRMMNGGGGRFSMFPFPNYSTRTRGGTQVSVGGCCLPLPIGCLTILAGAAAAAVAASRRA